MSDNLSRSVFTIEVDRRPVLMFSIRSYADAQAICTDSRIRQKLSSIFSGGKPLCDDIAIMRVRLARPEEKAKYLEEAATRSHETGLIAVYLVKLDRAKASEAGADLFGRRFGLAAASVHFYTLQIAEML